MLRKRHGRSEKFFIPPKLMLTAIMDMFTIILIFLLFFFPASSKFLKLDKKLKLPSSTVAQCYDKDVKLVLTKKELRLNDEIMATVHNYQIDGLRPDDLKSSKLYHELKAVRKAQKAAKVPGTTDDNTSDDTPYVLFFCDKSYSFKIIKSVIKTAALAGYPIFRFAVLEE